MAVVDSTALSAELQESKVDFQKIFALKVRDGFGRAKEAFTTLRTDQKVGLKREIATNIVQPGRTGVINNQPNFLTHKDKVPVLYPAKVDLYLDEVALYKLRTGFLNKMQAADVTDIHSIAGRDYIMNRVFKQIGKEVHAAIYRSALGFGYDGTNAGTIASSAFQGGLNLFTGLGARFTHGFTAIGSGGAGDIPSGNKVASPAGGGFTESTAIAELKKMLDVIYDTPELHDLAVSDDPEDMCTLTISPAYAKAISNALDALTYKKDQVVEAVEGGFRFKILPRVMIKTETFMTGVDNMYFAPKANMFWLTPMTDEDVAAIKFQEVGRGVQILIDFECSVDYADGRQVALYK